MATPGDAWANGVWAAGVWASGVWATTATFSGALQVGGTTTIPVRTAVQEDRQSLGAVKRSFHGHARRSVITDRPYRRVLRIETAWDAVADVRTLESTLRAPGTKNFDGWLVGGSSTDMLVQGLTYTPSTDNTLASLSFRLVQVTP